jgi:hypothetical protein
MACLSSIGICINVHCASLLRALLLLANYYPSASLLPIPRSSVVQ